MNALKAMPTCLNFEAVAESMEVWVETHADVSSVWWFLLNDVSFLDVYFHVRVSSMLMYVYLFGAHVLWC